MALLVLGHLASQSFSRTLDLFGWHIATGQFAQQLVPFLEGDHRTNMPERIALLLLLEFWRSPAPSSI